jgi:hypothetical protein
MLSFAVPKRQYYYLSPAGRRLFDLALGEATLAFIGAGSKPDILQARQLITKHGDCWAGEWLRVRGFGDWAEYLGTLCARVEAPGRPLLSNSRVPPPYINGTAKQAEIDQ